MMTLQDVFDLEAGNANAWNGNQEHLFMSYALHLLVYPTLRITVRFDGAPGKVDEPGKRDASLRIKRHFHLPVTCHSGVRNFDDHKDISSGRKRGFVIIGLCLK